MRKGLAQAGTVKSRKRYDTDLTDVESNRLDPVVPTPDQVAGLSGTHAGIQNGIFYIVRSGSAW